MRWGKYKHFTIERAINAFMLKISADESTGCWNWTGARNGRYGNVGLMGKSWLAHRAAWLLLKGEDPKENCVLHRCDNGFCVNPEHLFLGTQEDNVLDCENKGRAYHPSRMDHGRAKLTEGDVFDIRTLYVQGMPIRAIARQYQHVNRTTIARIVHNKTWITK